MIKQFGIVLGILFLLALFISSCTSDSKELLIPSTCDTVNMKYATDIVRILESNCYSCHGNGNTGGSGGINLQNYTTLKKYADNGQLYGNISHAPGYVAMPYGLPKMDECLINKILDWINQGATNN
jgi:hypothetical protein